MRSARGPFSLPTLDATTYYTLLVSNKDAMKLSKKPSQINIDRLVSAEYTLMLMYVKQALERTG